MGDSPLPSSPNASYEKGEAAKITNPRYTVTFYVDRVNPSLWLPVGQLVTLISRRPFRLLVSRIIALSLSLFVNNVVNFGSSPFLIEPAAIRIANFCCSLRSRGDASALVRRLLDRYRCSRVVVFARRTVHRVFGLIAGN